MNKNISIDSWAESFKKYQILIKFFTKEKYLELLQRQVVVTGKWVVVAISLLGAVAHPQTSSNTRDLTLIELIESTNSFYPSMRAARFDATASNEDVTAARLQRWPTVTVTNETNTGNLRSYPMQAVQVQQTLWDFGRISARIAEAEATADVGLLNVYIQQQDLTLQVIGAWQSLQASRKRVNVAERTLGLLTAYQAQMSRRVDAEASPRIDLELVNARYLQTQVELATAQASLQVALLRLEQLSGLESLQSRLSNATPMPSIVSTLYFADIVKSADWIKIATESPAVAKARAQMQIAKNRYEGKKAEIFPQVFLRAYKPLNTIPTSNDTSTTTFVGLSYSTGTGFSTLAEAQALSTRISSAESSVESALLEMRQTLQSDREEFISSRIRAAALENAVNGSELVLISYKRQFVAGKKSWLDLLNAVRELAQNQYAYVDAQSSMMGAMNRLQLRMGLPLQ